MECIDCPDFKVSGYDSGNIIGYCLSDSVPGTINPKAKTDCKNHPEAKKQLSDKMFNNKLGVIKG